MAVKNSLAKSGPSKPQTFSAFLTSDAIKQKINGIVGGKDGQRFISAVVSAVSTNPALAKCEHSTILSAALLGESLKLSPSPQLGQYYMVPYEDNKNGRTVATFQLGYKGYVQLAERSGYYKKLNVLPIKEGELVHYDPLEETVEVNLIDDEVERENAPTMGYYAMFEYHNGFRKVMYWSKAKMIAHADRYSKAFSKDAKKGKTAKYDRVSFADYEAGNVKPADMWLYSSFWYKDFDGMACKTMLRRLISKWGIMSIDLQRAFESDMSMLHEDGTPEYVDNQPDVDVSIPASEVVEVDHETGEIIEESAAQEAQPEQAAAVEPEDEAVIDGFFNQ